MSSENRINCVPKREPLYPDWASQHSLVPERDPLTTRKKSLILNLNNFVSKYLKKI